MIKNYELLSGEKIQLSSFSETQLEHVSKIEQLIANSEDYFEVERQAFGPLKEGRIFNAKQLTELSNSPQYKVIFDLVTRYHKKLYNLPDDYY